MSAGGRGSPNVVCPDQDGDPRCQLGRIEDQESTEDAPQGGRPRQSPKRLQSPALSYRRKLARAPVGGAIKAHARFRHAANDRPEDC